ncbi:hypothetical protein GLW20_12135 [Virgibacillus halodenitrificans]|nr:hypothetical protein [Virgibacillus halodenitrificans]
MEMNEITSIVGVVVAIVAVGISVASLIQNQKSVERANRPYVVVYMDILQLLSSRNKFIIIKNFGKTGAIINSLTFFPEYYSKPLQQEVFKNIKDTFIAPNQSFTTIKDLGKSDDYKKITAKIKYSVGKKQYEDEFILNEYIAKDALIPKTKPSENLTKEEVLTNLTEEVLRRSL